MANSSNVQAVDARVRQAVYGCIVDGLTPRRAEVARRAAVSEADALASYERLADAHVLVLDSESRDVWMAMPFSTVPTAFRVEADGKSWWANCAWDALGVAAALDRDIHITTTCADCDAPLVLDVVAGRLQGSDAVGHFAVPAAEWWTDIGFT